MSAGADLLRDANVAAFGISFDDLQAHCAFRDKYALKLPLLMDTDRNIARAYGVGDGDYPQRKTFVIDQEGTLVAVIDKIDFANHAAQITAAVKQDS